RQWQLFAGLARRARALGARATGEGGTRGVSIATRPHERTSPYTTATLSTKFRVGSAGGDLHMSSRDHRDNLPDVRDGLTHRNVSFCNASTTCSKSVGGEMCLRGCCMEVWSSM